jgi:hypothetical protein
MFDHLARKRSQQEGQRIIDALLDLRMDSLYTPRIEPEAAISEVTRRLSTKRLKVLATACPSGSPSTEPIGAIRTATS